MTYFRMIVQQTMVTDVDPVLVTENVRHFAFRALAKTHTGRRVLINVTPVYSPAGDFWNFTGISCLNIVNVSSQDLSLQKILKCKAVPDLCCKS